MKEKYKKAIKKNEKFHNVYVAIYIIGIVLIVSPLAAFDGASGNKGVLDLPNLFVENLKGFKMFWLMFRPSFLLYFIKYLIAYTLVFAFVMWQGIKKSVVTNEFEKIEHGSSDWCKDGEQYSILSETDGLILAKDNYLPLDKRGNINVLIVGGSGSGKSSAYSIPNAMQEFGSYVFTDPKGEIYDKTAGYLKQHGYDIKVLNLVSPQNSDGYNPLMHISSDLDIDIIANTIITGQEEGIGGSDPFWDNNAESLLKALIYYLLAVRPEEEQNLASCSELVRAGSSSNGSNLLTSLMSQLPTNHPARIHYRNIEIAPEKTYSSILSTLQSKLGKFDSKEIASVTSTDTFNFEDIGRKKTAVYVISSDTHKAYDFLLTIFFAQMIQQLYAFADSKPDGESSKLQVPVFFILDEFANIGKIPDFDKKISTSRSRGISFSVILQNLDQLEAVYKNSYETIMGNCDTHVFLGSNSLKTVEYFSKMLGEKTIKNKTKNGKNESESSIARTLMTPDELRRMDNNKCIIFEKGLKPIKADKFFYFEQRNASKLSEYVLNCNDYFVESRGNWRTFNPLNPYSEKAEEEQVKDLNVGSLDDLFGDYNEKSEENDKKSEEKSVNHESLFQDLFEDLEANEPKVTTVREKEQLDNKNKNEELEETFNKYFHNY